MSTSPGVKPVDCFRRVHFEDRERVGHSPLHPTHCFRTIEDNRSTLGYGIYGRCSAVAPSVPTPTGFAPFEVVPVPRTGQSLIMRSHKETLDAKEAYRETSCNPSTVQ